MSLFIQIKGVARLLLLGVALIGLSACAGQQPASLQPGTINDPFEATNRGIHDFNRAIDRAILRPTSKGYVTVVPEGIQDSVGNFATNLSMPSVAVNSLLQGDLRGTGLATARFVMNSTVGLLGLIDAADEFGVPDHDTDFGETLYVWGAGEGPYLELPILGPSTSRAAVGKVVDLFTNPLSYRLDAPEENYGPIANVFSRIGDRGRYSDTIDSILYDSADSYAQSRLIYLDNRRFHLGGPDRDDYEDPYSDSSSDPYEALNAE